MINSLLTQIKNHDTIILLRHIFPDYDAIGSQMGLTQFILDNFSDKKVLVGGTLPPEYTTIGRVDDIKAADFVDALVITTDTSIKERIDMQDINDLSKARTVFKVDHHVNEQPYGDFEIVDASYPATCELLTKLFVDSNLIFSKKTAFCLYHGLITDTDRFMYRSVSARTFDMASVLLQKGIDFKAVYENIYNLDTNLMYLKGYILSNFKVSPNKVAYMIITKEILQQFNITDPHTVALWVNMLGDLKEAKVWLFFVETPDFVRVEFRSNRFSVREFAQQFNGGGHKTAAGAKVDCIADCQKVVSYCDEQIVKQLNK